MDEGIDSVSGTLRDFRTDYNAAGVRSARSKRPLFERSADAIVTANEPSPQPLRALELGADTPPRMPLLTGAIDRLVSYPYSSYGNEWNPSEPSYRCPLVPKNETET